MRKLTIEGTQFSPADGFQDRQAALRRRVEGAARALSEQGVKPTVARIRAALGGGSPNDLAPALKRWKDSLLQNSWDIGKTPLRAPVQIADLVQELWQRAIGAAVVEVRGGRAARKDIFRDEELQSLKAQVEGLHDQLQRESLAVGELRAQSARHEAVAREALSRVDASSARERHALRDLGATRERMQELEATLRELRARLFEITSRQSRQKQVLRTKRAKNRVVRRPPPRSARSKAAPQSKRSRPKRPKARR